MRAHPVRPPLLSDVSVEVAAGSPADASSAAACGADRIELCRRLETGGVSPERSDILAALECLSVPVVVLVRPRPGGFVFDDAEAGMAIRTCRDFASLGTGGFVTGALTHDHGIDTGFIERVREAAGGIPIIFHRAFDLVSDKLSALDSLIDLGVVRVLTSGGAASAPEGARCLAGLIEHAGDTIEILPGGGIRASNAPGLVMATGSGWIHGSFSRTGGDGLRAFDPAEMRALLRALGRDGQAPPQTSP